MSVCGVVYSRFHVENFQQLQALIFAVEEINRNPLILPNITLGFQAFDSCDILHQDLGGTLRVLTGFNTVIPNYRCVESIPLAGVVGASSSSHSISMAHILGLYRFPQISYFSTSPALSDRRMFPSFFRTVPSDTFQSEGLAHLVLHLGWTWVGLLAVDNDYGQQGIQLVKQELIKAGACVAFTESILLSQPNRNAQNIVKVIKESTAAAIIVFSPTIHLVFILDEMLVQNITNKILVASEAWSTSTLFSDEKFPKILSGTIGLALHSESIPRFREFLNKVHPSVSVGTFWVKLLWEKTFNCKFVDGNNVAGNSESPIKECTGAEVLKNTENTYNDVSNLRATYNVYTAVYALARALENFKKEISPVSNFKCTDMSDFKPWQLLHYVKKVKITMNSGRELFFNENGDPPAVYDIVNWKVNQAGAIKPINVGNYDIRATSSQVFTVNMSAISWASGDQQVPYSKCSPGCPLGFRKIVIRGKPVCCFQCVPCPQGEINNNTDSVDCFRCPWDEWPNPLKSRCLQKSNEYLSFEDPLGLGLAIAAILSSCVPFFILRLFAQYKRTPIVKANNYLLSSFLLLCLPLCFLSSLAFIGYPQLEHCLMRQAAFGLVFALCIACILAKTIMVVFAFMATKPGSQLKRWTSPIVSYVVIVTCFLLQFILCASWLLKATPFLEYNTHTKPGIIIIECNNGSSTAFWGMMGYLGLLATISFVVAFLARRLPDTFNEAKFITFSMVAFLSVWVSFIPASLSTQGKYTEAMEIFAILSSSWALVICMFIPKCFIILFRPNTNSRRWIMKKYTGHSP